MPRRRPEKREDSSTSKKKKKVTRRASKAPAREVAKKKMAALSSICAVDGCEKKAKVGAFCAAHDKANDMMENIVRVSELEAAQFGRIHAEMQHYLQGLELNRMRAGEVSRQMEQQLKNLSLERAQLEQSVSTLRPQYASMVTSLAKKYKIHNPKTMSIDTESRIVRDLSIQQKE